MTRTGATGTGGPHDAGRPSLMRLPEVRYAVVVADLAHRSAILGRAIG